MISRQTGQLQDVAKSPSGQLELCEHFSRSAIACDRSSQQQQQPSL